MMREQKKQVSKKQKVKLQVVKAEAVRLTIMDSDPCGGIRS